MKELIDKSKLLEELKKCEKICEGYMSSHKDTVSQGIANAKRAVCQHFIKFLNTLEVKETDDAYKQGYNDAIDKACDAYCRLCDTKECGDTGECEWVEKFRKRLMRQQWKRKN